jgi:pimeloyl-ACP methyl ester carboxylesterase
MPAAADELIVEHGGVRLSAERSGEGPLVVLLHGLTATRRYVVMGSSALARAGHTVIAYDARGHGRSTPAPSAAAYTYGDLRGDLEAVLDAHADGPAVLAGASLGAHTALALALADPARVAGLVLITPAYEPRASLLVDSLAGWDALAHGLREGGVEGFVRAYDLDAVAEPWRATIETVIR